MSIYLGIDFGTSTNFITKWDENTDSVRPVPNLDPAVINGNEVFSNVIYYQPDGGYVVGEAAARRMLIDNENGVIGIKRKLLEPNWKRRLTNHGIEKNAIDISTDIFTYIRTTIEENSGGNAISGVVISVPYSYGHKERLAIKRSAECAGLPVIDLVEEPVAAAISYGLFEKKPTMGKSEKIFVFDFGGGTLDITVFEYYQDSYGNVEIEVLNTEGVKNFGGLIVDEIIASKIAKKANINYEEIEDSAKRLAVQAQMKEISKALKEDYKHWEEDEEYDIIERIQGIQVDIMVTYEELENWIRSSGFMDQINVAINNALFDCEIEPDEVDKVILVGGSSSLPIVKKKLKEVFHKEPQECGEINKMVGTGAGIFCGLRVKNDATFTVIQKLSYSIGVKVGTKFSALIEKNERYGKFSEIKEYCLTSNGAKRDIEVYQGNSLDITKCFLIGKIPITQLDLSEINKIGIRLGTDEKGMVRYQVYDGTITLLEGEVE